MISDFPRKQLQPPPSTNPKSTIYRNLHEIIRGPAIAHALFNAASKSVNGWLPGWLIARVTGADFCAFTIFTYRKTDLPEVPGSRDFPDVTWHSSQNAPRHHVTTSRRLTTRLRTGALIYDTLFKSWRQPGVMDAGIQWNPSPETARHGCRVQRVKRPRHRQPNFRPQTLLDAYCRQAYCRQSVRPAARHF